MFKFMLKIADFVVENGYIEVATEKNYMKERIEASLEAIVFVLCLLIIWNATILLYKNFEMIHIAMGLCFYDLIHEGFRMRYFIHKLNFLGKFDDGIAKIMQRKIICIWFLAMIMACIYSINCDIRAYSFKCTMAIIK